MEKKYEIGDFLETRSATGASFSPDGNHIAFLSNISGTMQAYLTPRNGGKAEQLTFYDEPVSFISFSPVKNELIFGINNGGSENIQFFLIDLATKNIRSLTNDPNIKHLWAGWSRDGKFITYSSNARNGTDFDVYIMEVSTGASRCIFNGGGACYSMGFSPKGNMIAVKKHHTGWQHDLYLVDVTTGTHELITKEGEKSVLGSPRWQPDESGFFITTNKERDFTGLYFYSTATKKGGYVLTPNNEIDATTLSFDGRHIAVILNEDGYGALSVYDTATMVPLPNHVFPKGVIWGTQWSNDGQYLAFTFASAIKNADIWIWSRSENICRQLTKSPRRVPENVFAEPKLIHYDSFDGLRISAFLFLPKMNANCEKVPAIVDIHGGPESQHRPGFYPLMQYFIYRGYAVVAPNVRGSYGYGKKFLALDDREKRMDSITDLGYLHKFLEQHPGIDHKKIALMGASYGGFMTLAGLTFQPNLWAAGVDIVGISNLVSFLENTAPYRRALREAEYGYLATDREFLKSISPFNFVDNIRAPLLIIHGANDPRVPLSEAEQIYQKVRAHGQEADLLVYADEGHGLAKLKNRLDAYPKIADFLDKIFSKN